MPPKACKRKNKESRSDSESEVELRSGRTKQTLDYRTLHEGKSGARQDLSPVEEDSESSGSSVSRDGRSRSEQSPTPRSDYDSESERSEEYEDLRGVTPHSSDEGDLDQQIRRQKASLEKIQHIEEQSKKRISSLEKTLRREGRTR